MPKVLVVEDETIVATELQDKLHSMGYEVPAVASSGEQAIDQTALFSPDLLLIDIMLKGESDGIEIAEEIRRRFDVPVIYLTACTDEDTLQRAKITEPFGYIVKPFEERELHSTISMALHKHKMQKELEARIQYRLAIEEALAQASRLLVSQKEVDLQEVLQVIGKAVSANRAFIVQLREHGKRSGNTHRWCAPGCVPQMADRHELAAAPFAWWMKRLEGDENIRIEDVSALPDEAEAEKEFLRAQHVRSCLCAPIHAADGSLRGFMGFEDIEKCRDWFDEEIKALRVVGEMVGFCWDRKQSEEVLRESQEKYRELVENVNDVIFSLDRDGMITYISPVLEKIFGYRPSEVTGRSFSEFIYPEDLSALQQSFQKTLAGDLEPFEFRVVTKDGQTRWVRSSSRPTSQRGGVVGVQGVLSDITQRKRAEEALERQKAYLDELFEAAPEAIVLLDTQDRVIRFNREFRRLFGYTNEEARNRQINDLIVPEDLREEAQAYTKMVCQGEKVVADSVRRCKDGTLLAVSILGVPIRLESGQIAVYGIYRDITKRKRTEETLNKRFKQLNAIYLLTDICNRAGRLEEIYQNALEALRFTLETERAAIQLLDSAGLMRFTAWHGLSEAYRKSVEGHSPWGVDEAKPPPILISDVEKASGLDDLRAATLKEGIRALGFIPLVYHDKLLGKLMIYYDEVHEFSKQELRLAQTIAHHVAFATMRKRAIAALRANEEQTRRRAEEWQQTFDAVGEAVLQMDETGRIIRANRAAAQLCPELEGPLVGKYCYEVLHACHRSPTDCPHELARLQGVPASGEVFEPHREQWLAISANPTKTEGDGPYRTVLVARDITEHKRAAEALRESEEKYRTLFEESKDAVFISTTQGKLLDINPAGVELFGYASKEELLQVDIAEELYLNPRDRALFQRTFEKQGFVKDYELILKRKDGAKLIVHETATAVRDKEGKIVAIRGILRDLTGQKILEEQLLQTQKMESIGTFAGGVAHDFNNLLTAILGNVELGLQDLPPSHPAQEDLIEIRKAANKASDLTDQLLSFSRRQVLKQKPLDLSKTVADLLKMLQRILGEDIELNLKLAPKLATVFANAGQMQQVLMNLFANARDAMPKGGKLSLETRLVTGGQIDNLPELSDDQSKWVEITITDTGCGMDEETQSRIFEPFFTTKGVGKGTGLGLSVVYGIVKQHDGHIEVHSKVNKGTTFKIFFPTVPDAEAVEREEKKTPPRLDGEETILIVEDDDTVRNVAVRILNGLSYKVLMARDGQEALHLFETERDKIDLVLMDVVMPKESGPEIYDKMNALKPDLPVIFVTGYDVDLKMNEFGRRAEQEAVTLLQKPYTKDTLGEKIREILER